MITNFPPLADAGQVFAQRSDAPRPLRLPKLLDGALAEFARLNGLSVNKAAALLLHAALRRGAPEALTGLVR